MIELKLNDQPFHHAAEGQHAVLCLNEWQAAEFSCVPPPDCALTLTLEGPSGLLSLQPFLHPGDPAWRWHWNPQNSTGRFLLTLRAIRGSGIELTQVRAVLDVLPAKISQHHYELLLHDIQHTACTVVQGLARSSAGIALHLPDQDVVPLLPSIALCRFYEQRVSHLERLVSAIACQPHHVLRQHSSPVSLEQVRDMGGIAPREMALIGDTVEVRQSSSVPDTNTYENRLLKHLLAAYSRRVRAMTAHAHDQSLAACFAALLRRLERLNGMTFLASAGPLVSMHGASHMIRRDPRYRQVYRLWQEVRQRPVFALDCPLFHLPVHNLPRLYESWCALLVAAVLLNLPGAEVCQQQLVVQHSPAAEPQHADVLPPYRLTLSEDSPLLVLTWRGAELRLRYQPRYCPHQQGTPADLAGSLDAYTHIPDLALEWQRPGHPLRVLVFDAKYRLEEGGGLPRAALADAYTYLGSIGLSDGTRVVAASLLLYPGQSIPELHASNTGAFPLLPGQVESFRVWLQQRLTRSSAL
jgi:large subunit ribosomal protein MRP49